MNIQQTAREFCEGAFKSFGVDVEPYTKIVAELLQTVADDAATSAFQQVGRALVEASDGFDGDAASALRDVGRKLETATKESLLVEGLMVLAEEIMAEDSSARQ